jgi:lipopolysaccharide export system permease protein
MPITSRYILAQVTPPMLSAVAIGLALLLSERLVRLLDLTLGKKKSFSLIFEMLSYLVPHYLGIALPAALFLGLLFGFSRLSKDSELDAFLAAGYGLHQIARPVIILSCLLSLVAVAIFGFIQPHSRYLYRAVVNSIKSVDVFYLAEEGVFMRVGKRTFILDELSRGNNKFKRIFMYEDGGARGSETVTASKGALIEIDQEDRPVLRLEAGHRLKLKGQFWGSQKVEKPGHDVAEFKIIDTPLGEVTKAAFRIRGIDQREFTLPELWRAFSKRPEKIDENSLNSEFNRRIVLIMTVLVLPFLAIPFSIGRRRGQRPYRFGIVLLILIAYNEIIEQGALSVRTEGASPFLAMWLPYILFAAFSLWRFYRTALSLTPDRLELVVDLINDGFRRVFSRFFKPASE